MARLAAGPARVPRRRARRGQGPRAVRAGDLRDGGPRKREPWWSWDDAKVALEVLFVTGAVSARRLPNFEREYDLTERILPAAVLDATDARPSTSRGVELLALAARALGVATATRPVRLLPAQHPEVAAGARRARRATAGWCRWTSKDGRARPTSTRRRRIPRRVNARTLLSPFDSLVWERDADRARSSASTTASRSTRPRRSASTATTCCRSCSATSWSARVDLKSDRQESALLVPAAWGEPGVFDEEVAEELLEELQELAGGWASNEW